MILSFKENREIEDIKDCGDENGEIAFWSIEVRLKDISKAGSLNFKECQVAVL